MYVIDWSIPKYTRQLITTKEKLKMHQRLLEVTTDEKQREKVKQQIIFYQELLKKIDIARQKIQVR